MNLDCKCSYSYDGNEVWVVVEHEMCSHAKHCGVLNWLSIYLLVPNFETAFTKDNEIK